MIRRFAARTLGVFSVLALASCFGDSTGPELRRGYFAITPLVDAVALRLVPVDRVHLVLRHADNSIALDTTIVFPPGEDTLVLSLSVEIQGATEQLTLDLSMLDVAGNVVFQAPPTQVTAVAGTSGVPVSPPLLYVGPGANATTVRFVTAPTEVFFGQTASFVAEAVDANDVVVPNAPIEWSSSDPARASVPDPTQGQVVAASARGSVTVTASLLRTSVSTTPASVTGPLTVQPVPNQIAVESGDNQQGSVGTALTQPVTARVRASDNQGVRGVVVTFLVTAGGGSLSNATDTTDANGDASVIWTLGLTLGPQGVSASAAGVAGSTSFDATGVAGPATQLVFTPQPANGTAGQPLAAMQVTARDALGNTATSFTANVTIAIGANPGGATLGGTATVAAVAGVATFSNLSLSAAGTGYTLTATSGALPPATSSTFDVVPAVPTRVGFVVQPSLATAGATMTPAIQVAIQDAGGNTVTTATDNVTLAIQSNPGGGTLSGTATVAAVAGVATFSTLSINRSGTGYTLLAVSTGLTSATSAGFDIAAGAPTQLVFTTQPPAGAGQGAPFTVAVSAQDGLGNTNTAFVGNVAVAIGTNPASGTLSGTTTVAAVAGVATFTTLSIDNTGTGYTLQATGGGLTAAISNAFDVGLSPSANQWINPAGGNWSNPANWSTGTVPTSADTVAIVLSGTYTVNADVAPAYTLLLLGGAGGAQFLDANSRTFANQVTIGPSGVLVLSSSTVAGTLVNQGMLLVRGSSAINGALTNISTSVIRIEGNGTQGTGALTVATGFTNLGAIELTSVGSGFPSQLTVTSGTLTNAGAGTIAALPGVGGARTLTGQLDNQGTLTVSAPLTWNQAAVSSTNSGTIDVSGADLALSLGGGGLSNTGTITVAASRTWTLSSGTFNQSGGTLGGTGALSLVSVTANFAVAFTNATTTLLLNSVTLNGPGGLTNAAGRTLVLQSSTVGATMAFDNQGLLLVRGSSAINGTLTTGAGSTLQVEGNGTQGTGALTVATGFSNNATIELTSAGSGFPSQLTVTSGTLTNAGAGTIAALPGVGGARTLTGQLDNQGTLTVSAPLTWNQAAVSSTNSGTIDVSGADLALSLGGGGLSNTGTITVAASRTWTLSSGTFNQSGGTLGGTGALSLVSVTANFAVAFTNATTTLLLNSVTLNGPGGLTNAAGRTLVLQSSTVGATMAFDNQGLLLVRGSSAINGTLTTGAGSTLQVEGNGTQGTGHLTVATGFSNNATIELTSAGSGFPSQLTVTSGTLSNQNPNGLIVVSAGAGGARTLAAQLDNQGTLTISAPQGLTLGRADADQVSSNTINVTGGDLTIVQSGATPTFFLDGTINIPTGRTMTVNGGVFNDFNGTLSGGGAMVLSSTTLNLVSTTVLNTSGVTLTLSSSTVNGPGDLINAAGQSLSLTSSSILANFDNLGVVVARGTSAISGFTTGAGSTVQVEGNGTQGTAALTVAGGFFNQGMIELTSVGSGFPAQFNLTAGTITNGSTGTIRSLPGVGGARTFNAALDNQGLVTVQTTTAFPQAMNSTGTMTAQTGALQLGGGGTFANILNTSGGGVIELAGGDWGLTANALLTGDMLLSGNAALESFNGHTLTITGTFNVTATSRLDMTGVNDSVIVQGNATIGGSTAGTLSNGVLMVGGNFTQLGAGTQFRATANHVTVLNGSAPQSVNFQAPGTSRFAGLRITNSGSGVTFLSDASVTDTLDLMDAHAPITGAGRKVTLHNGALLDTAVITPVFLVDTLVIRGQPTNSGNWPSIIQAHVTIDSATFTFPGTLTTAAGRNVRITSFAGGTAVVDASSPAGGMAIGGNLLVDGNGVMNIGYFSGVNVAGNATFASAVPNTGFTEGTLTIGGSFSQSGHAESFVASGNHQVSFQGTGPHTISFTSPGAGAGTSRFHRLDFTASGGSYTLGSDVFAGDLSIIQGDVNGPHRLTTSGSVVFASGPMLGVRSFALNGGSVSDDGITYAVDTTILRNDDYVVPGFSYNHLVVEGSALFWNPNPGISGSLTVSGDFNLGGNSMDVAGNLATVGTGTLRMQNSEQLTVNGDATFTGGDHTDLMTFGVLLLNGNFQQGGATPTSFTPGQGFETRMVGTGLQTINFANPSEALAGGSQFGNLSLENVSAAGVRLQTRTYVSSQLRTGTASATRLIGPAGDSLVAVDIDLNDLELDSVLLVVRSPAGGGAMAADNITFDQYDPLHTQFTIQHQGQTMLFNGLTFNTVTGVTGTGNSFHLRAVDTDAVPDLTVQLQTPTPGSAPPGRFQQVNGANVVWPFP